MVFFAGLPGTGKSLLVHQLAHVAIAAGRSVHLLQWDVARPRFEACSAGQLYPQADGVTHPLIRRAAGRWVRHAIAEWHDHYPAGRHLLIGETPLIGNRFSELAHRWDDAAEALLGSESCRFVIAVPSAAVRAFIEAERDRRTASPLHPREREDAPPHVLRDLWRDLLSAGDRLGLGPAGGHAGGLPYDPVLYRRIYEAVLRHRATEALSIDIVLPSEAISVYDFAEPLPDLLPADADAERFTREAERQYPQRAALDDLIARWWCA